VALETIGINGGPGKVVESSVQIGLALCWTADGRLLYAGRNDPRSESFDYGIRSVGVNEKPESLSASQCNSPRVWVESAG
jgi:hypothetical protein